MYEEREYIDKTQTKFYKISAKNTNLMLTPMNRSFKYQLSYKSHVLLKYFSYQELSWTCLLPTE